MKGSYLECKFCGLEELKVNRANETIQCEGCDRILEERYNDFRANAVNFERDSPFCVVTTDELAEHKFPEALPDDPFHTAGFITAFSHISLQQLGVFTLTSRTFPGDLADLERVLHDLDIDCPTPASKMQPPIAGQKTQKKKDTAGNAKLRHVLVAYFEILEVAEIMGIPRDDCDEALRLFKKFADSSSNVRSKNVESLAVAALVLVLRQADRSRDLPEFAAASGLLQKDLIQGIKAVQQALDTSTQSSTASISSHMPQFCRVLGMQSSAENLAITIGENATANSVCTRRNPISIAAAAIYLACNLEDQKKTQTEICKVTGLTEVTLRKVYKELLLEHDKLIPVNYLPKVRLQTLLPLSMAGANRSQRAENPKESAASVVASTAGLSSQQHNPLLFPAFFPHQHVTPEQVQQQASAMGLDRLDLNLLAAPPAMFPQSMGNPYQQIFQYPHLQNQQQGQGGRGGGDGGMIGGAPAGLQLGMAGMGGAAGGVEATNTRLVRSFQQHMLELQQQQVHVHPHMRHGPAKKL